MNFVLNLLAGAIRVTIPIAFAALAGMLAERAGIINMGLEGMMLFGAFFSVSWFEPGRPSMCRFS